MSRPEVSVVIPTYNRRGMVENAITSVYAQSFRDFEIILVDDGSSDGTDAAISNYFKNTRTVCEHDDVLMERPVEKEKLRYFRFSKNGGIPRALNKGYELAKGKYVCQLSSDDVWVQDKLETQIPFMENPDVGMVYADYNFVERETRSNGLDYDLKYRRVEVFYSRDKKTLFHHLLSDCCMNACTFLMRREFCDTIGPYSMRPEYEWNQDLHFNLEACLTDKWVIAKQNRVVANVLIHPGSASKQGKCGLGNNVMIPDMIAKARSLRGWFV